MCRTLIVRYETPDQEKVEFELERALFHFHFVKGSRVCNKTVTIANLQSWWSTSVLPPYFSLHPAFSLLEKNMQLLQLIFQRKCWYLWGVATYLWLLQLIFRRICEVRTPVSAQCQGTTRVPLGEEGPRPTHQLAIGNSAKRRLRPRPRTMHVERLLVKQALVKLGSC